MDGKKTPFYQHHRSARARLVDFAGWVMPIQYPGGIIAEHLATRKTCGLFDVSHMGRYVIRGGGALPFLQRVLTCDVAGLPVGKASYALLADADGGAIDDAYLYRFVDHEYLLVVNAANRDKDWAHLEGQADRFADVVMEDVSDHYAMLAVQGPASEAILAGLAENGALPAAQRNCLGRVRLAGADILVGRTGYTGEPICFELFLPAEAAGAIWEALVEAGACPAGLGARDTLRLEASLPLYGHEFGTDPEGRVIPILACPTARFGVCLEDGKGDFIGREALSCQMEALKGFRRGQMDGLEVLPRRIRSLVVVDRGIARAGDAVVRDGEPVGVVTSGTMVPYWHWHDDNGQVVLEAEHGMRAVALGLIDSRVGLQETVHVRIRGRDVAARTVPRNLENRTGPVSHAVLPEE